MTKNLPNIFCLSPISPSSMAEIGASPFCPLPYFPLLLFLPILLSFPALLSLAFSLLMVCKCVTNLEMIKSIFRKFKKEQLLLSCYDLFLWVFFYVWLGHDTIFPPFASSKATKLLNVPSLIKDTH